MTFNDEMVDPVQRLWACALWADEYDRTERMMVGAYNARTERGELGS